MGHQVVSLINLLALFAFPQGYYIRGLFKLNAPTNVWRFGESHGEACMPNWHRTPLPGIATTFFFFFLRHVHALGNQYQ